MSTSSQPLLIERRPGGVVLLTLNNPERRNALDPSLAQALLDIAGALRGDRTARCVVLTGAGTAFCSGADLGALKEGGGGGALARREKLVAFYDVFLDIRRLPMPVIAAVNGGAIGAGLNLALCCDVRVAGRSARFGATFVRLGIHAGGGATYMLSRLVGPALAAEMMLSGELVHADRALSIGLANRVVDDADLVGSALALASTIAANSPQAVRATKRTLAVAAEATFLATLEVEALAQAVSQDSAEATEGWLAFREKRAPEFPD